jgi:hypothetical protein
MAGGTFEEAFNAGAYNTTKYAKQGDLGSKVLPKRPTGTVWKRGSVASARWELTADHGGGYQSVARPNPNIVDHHWYIHCVHVSLPLPLHNTAAGPAQPHHSHRTS